MKSAACRFSLATQLTARAGKALESGVWSPPTRPPMSAGRVRLTVPVDVCGAGVPFPVAVRVGLVWVVVVGAVVAAVPHVVSVVVVLRWVVVERAVVLRSAERGRLTNREPAPGSGLRAPSTCTATRSSAGFPTQRLSSVGARCELIAARSKSQDLMNLGSRVSLVCVWTVLRVVSR